MLESFENWTLCLARSCFHLSFIGHLNTESGQGACQDDQVQVCLQGCLLVFVERIARFLLGKTLESLPVDFHLLNFVLQ